MSRTEQELPGGLGLGDLALTQVLFGVGLPWVGVAAKLGSARGVFWLAAIVLFYIPSAVGVIYLSRIMPLEGGEWLTSSKLFIAATSAVIMGGLTAVAVLGLGVGKWISKAGGVLMLATFG